MDKDDSKFEQKVRDIVRDYLKSSAFVGRKLTDTPTDALQVTNKKYVDTAVANIPINDPHLAVNDNFGGITLGLNGTGEIEFPGGSVVSGGFNTARVTFPNPPTLTVNSVASVSTLNFSPAASVIGLGQVEVDLPEPVGSVYSLQYNKNGAWAELPIVFSSALGVTTLTETHKQLVLKSTGTDGYVSLLDGSGTVAVTVTGNSVFVGDSTSNITVQASSNIILSEGQVGNVPTSDIVFGTPSILGTNATRGFVYIPKVGGIPAGTPSSSAVVSGQVPLTYDSANNKLYVYNGSWKSVALT